MTKVFRRMTLGFGAAAIAVLVAGAGYQHLSAQGPGPGGPGPRAGRGDFGPGPGGPMGRRGGPGGPGGPLGLGPMMLGRLDLTNDQRDRVKQILDSHRDDQKAIGDRAMKAHQALQEAITGTFDEGGIRARGRRGGGRRGHGGAAGSDLQRGLPDPHARTADEAEAATGRAEAAPRAASERRRPTRPRRSRPALVARALPRKAPGHDEGTAAFM